MVGEVRKREEGGKKKKKKTWFLAVSNLSDISASVAFNSCNVTSKSVKIS